METKPEFKNTSINIDLDILAWLDMEADRRKSNRSKIIMDIIRDRIESRPSGFLPDIDWLLQTQINPYMPDLVYLPNKPWDVAYDIYEYYDGDEIGYTFSRILIAENTRDRLRELFAEAVLESLDTGVATIMLIPYKLDPKHKVWAAFEKQDLLHVCTPETLALTIKKIGRAIKKEKEGQE